MPRFIAVHEKRLDSRLRGNDRLGVIPAKARYIDNVGLSFRAAKNLTQFVGLV